jgi:putative DNA primase/helicase
LLQELLALGRSVIPSGGGETLKSPVISWAEYQKRLPTIDELKSWYQNLHPTLWGIVTGAISNIVVYDADAPETMEIFHQAGLKPHVKTKRGEHYYFKHPGHLLNNKAGILPHLDMRGDGGFVNCIGHNQNAWYDILIFPTDESLYQLVQLPLVVKQALLADDKVTVRTRDISETVSAGQRNQTLASLAGTLRRRGLSQAVIESSLLACNKNVCVPPLPEREVLIIAKSISRYEPNRKNKPLGSVPL